MSSAPEIVLARVRDVVGTAGVERLAPSAVRLVLRELLFDGEGIPEWHDRAACRDTDPELFSLSTAAASRLSPPSRSVPAARSAPSVSLMMAWERPGYRYGVVGGLSVNERQHLHRANREAPKGGAAA